MSSLVSIERIEDRIILIRGQKVILDSDLAELYGVPTKSLNLSVKRNLGRFPEDFMFQLSEEEYETLRFQFETSKRGGRRYLPYAFTEHGILMLSSVLNSERAIMVNIQIMRAFTKLRKILTSHEDLKRKIEAMEERYDVQFKVVFETIKSLMTPLTKEQKRIGFKKD
ncbi:ORF6N domain-containing protein [bacterium]|nr:ORF6N domain-containing protein [bacterium]MBU1752375.1 ORF6N domain-containing protein [bacterium]